MHPSPISPLVRLHRVLLVGALVVVAGCRGTVGAPASSTPTVGLSSLGEVAPAPPPARWLPLLGEYGPESAATIVLERDGRLWVHAATEEIPLTERADGSFVSERDGRPVTFRRDPGGAVTAVELNGGALPRRQIGPASGNQLVITPVRPIDELRREALAATPPAERGPFLPSDLVELVKLDPTIKLEIRYATSNNLLGTPFYSQARAFCSARRLKRSCGRTAGCGRSATACSIHDGYRPWYVTKMFWDATPRGQAHLRRRSRPGLPPQPRRGGGPHAVRARDWASRSRWSSTYDETSARAYPTILAARRASAGIARCCATRWKREGFTVYEAEWWHFDFADWKRYPIGNTVFEQISAR